MFQFKEGYLVTILMCLVAFAQAYKLDPAGSCNGVQIDLVKSIENASKMAKQAASELGLLHLPNEHIKELKEYLFKPGDTGSVKKSLDVISKEFMAPSTKDDKRSPIIYCDFSRLEPMPDISGNSNFLRDTQNGFTITNDIAHKRCTGQVIGGVRAKAYTVTWAKVNQLDRQDFIQLCPWWLEHVSQQAHLSSNIPSDDEIKKTDFPPQDPPWMDVYLPVEQSLIHEFSHSYLAGKGMSSDHRYKWPECVSLTDGGQRCSNADSIGFFALGVEMIKKKGQKITKEGNFERINK